MKRKTTVIAALAGLWLAPLFGSGAGEEEMTVFTMSEKGESIVQVRAGQEFAIRFHAIPGTGYCWELGAELDKKFLAFIAEKNEESARESRLVGGREAFTWTFQALAAGEATIAMKYARPWEKGIEPLKRYVFKVKIEPKEVEGEKMGKPDEFTRFRQEMNRKILEQGNLGIKRFFALDEQAYQSGAIDAKTKELMGLVASMVLRCDDCISYHVIQARDKGATRDELFETFNVALVVGGSIVIPHLRRAVDFLEELENKAKSAAQ